MFGIVRDITQRQQQEASVRESAQLLQAIVENLPGGAVFVVDRNLRYLYAEGEALAIAGFKSEDFLGQTIFEVLLAELATYYEPMYRKALAGESFEHEHNAHNRSYVSRGTPLYAANGEVYAVLVVSYDITDRKRAEQTLTADLRDTQLLHALSTRLVSEDNIHALYQEIMEAAITLTQADAGTVQILDEATQDLLLLATHNFERDLTDHFYRVNASSNTSCGRALVTGERTFIDFDVPQSEDPDGSMRIHVEAGYLSAQSTPLIARSGRAMGMVSTHWRKHHRPSDRELRFLDLLARQAADLIEQRQVANALRESEAKYRSLFDSIDEGFCLFEMIYDQTRKAVDYRFLEVNSVFKQQTGLENVVGKLGSEIAPNTESYWLEAYDEVVKTGKPQRIENYNQSTERWYSAYASRVGGVGSRQVCTVFSDITDRKRTEQRQAFLLQLSDTLRSLTDPVEIQAEACRLLGEHLGVDRAYYVEVNEAEGYTRVNQNYLRGDSPSLVGVFRLTDYNWTMPFLQRGETIIVADAQTSDIIPNADREALATVKITAHITVPLIKAGTLVGSLCVTESAPRQWLAVEVELVRETAERIWATIIRARAETELRESEIQRFQEQTAREEERQRAETLAELDRAKTLFFSNVSHEFRTPLTLILAPLQDALSDAANPLPPAQRERLEIAHRNSLRLLKLVNTLLDFSRIEAGRMEACYEPTDLALYTTELASVFRSAIEQAGLRLIVDCPPLPESVDVDREMWEKIVLNLLSNAFKFTFEGEIAIRLHLADDHHVKLQVEDTGTGIEPEELPHLFERFYQVRGAKARTHEGSGIGLALVQELIKLHGGTVEVSSTVGQGSCFTVTIPLDTAHLPSISVAERDRASHILATRTLASTALGATPYVQEAERWIGEEAGEQGAGGELTIHFCPSSRATTARVLIVDDNADMRDYLTRILSEHVQVEAVADGVAALAAVNERVPDLVLSDVMMPFLDGFGLLKTLRSNVRTQEIPVILLSARAGEESVIEGLLAGADDYLIKPFSAQELVTRVNAYLQLAHLRSQTLHQERTINRRKDEVLSMVSHELNTPLVAILGWARLLQSNPPSPAMLSKALETIERNATLQAKVVEDLLDISRITASKISLNLEPVHLQAIIESAIATVQQSLQTQDIYLDFQLASAPVVLQGDRERLQQIILNLLTNAVKFTPDGGKIEINLQTDDDHAQITIADTGCGIDHDFLPHIFDTFSQAPSTKKGLGLGLAIARSLVELHGGTIVATSPGIGQGTTFTVKLPLISLDTRLL
ncbi:histidine kinase [Nostoc sp. CENA543]|nr:histidine kinase [Nostoc sp. CENA543]